jgi:hypothetical protein
VKIRRRQRKNCIFFFQRVDATVENGVDTRSIALFGAAAGLVSESSPDGFAGALSK